MRSFSEIMLGSDPSHMLNRKKNIIVKLMERINNGIIKLTVCTSVIVIAPQILLVLFFDAMLNQILKRGPVQDPYVEKRDFEKYL